MHLKSNNEEFKTYDNRNDIVYKLFKTLLSTYQSGLETSNRGSDFLFDSVELIYYKCYRINFRRGRSYVDSPDWIKIQKIKLINVFNMRQHLH